MALGAVAPCWNAALPSRKVVGDPDAVLATNTSSLPIVDLAVATERPGQVIGMHFFNPVPVQQLVELIPALATREETLDRTRLFATERLGKVTVQARDRSGSAVNTLLVPYLLAAVRMVAAGSAGAEGIDRGMELGCAHPMGSLRLLDLVGLDTVESIADTLYEEYKEPPYAPPCSCIAWSPRGTWDARAVAGSTGTRADPVAIRAGVVGPRGTCR